MPFDENYYDAGVYKMQWEQKERSPDSARDFQGCGILLGVASGRGGTSRLWGGSSGSERELLGKESGQANITIGLDFELQLLQGAFEEWGSEKTPAQCWVWEICLWEEQGWHRGDRNRPRRRSLQNGRQKPPGRWSSFWVMGTDSPSAGWVLT